MNSTKNAAYAHEVQKIGQRCKRVQVQGKILKITKVYKKIIVNKNKINPKLHKKFNAHHARIGYKIGQRCKRVHDQGKILKITKCFYFLLTAFEPDFGVFITSK